MSLGWAAAALSWAVSAHAAVAGPALSILIFHRVLEQPDPLFPGEIDARRFDALMRIVARGFRVVTVGQALAELTAGRLAPRTLAISFDDGYADNAEIALPILQRHALPATFFVATGFLDGGRMFNDTIIETLRHTVRPRVDLGAFGLGATAIGSVADRRAAIEALIGRIKYLPLVAREEALQRLMQACGNPALPPPPMMRATQVRQLHHAGMEIGGHTANHPILTELPDAAAEQEITQGRTALQSLLDVPVEVFAYPNGRPNTDYDHRHVAMVRRLGFRGAVSTAPGVATLGADPFELPRFTPWDRTPVRWSARLLLNLRQRAFATAGAAQPGPSR